MRRGIALLVGLLFGGSALVACADDDGDGLTPTSTSTLAPMPTYTVEIDPVVVLTIGRDPLGVVTSVSWASAVTFDLPDFEGAIHGGPLAESTPETLFVLIYGSTCVPLMTVHADAFPRFTVDIDPVFTQFGQACGMSLNRYVVRIDLATPVDLSQTVFEVHDNRDE